MPKQNQEEVESSEVTTQLAPATYKLVGIDPNAKNIHVPLMSREYVVEELAERLDVLEMLHRFGWAHVEKS